MHLTKDIVKKIKFTFTQEGTLSVLGVKFSQHMQGS